MLTFLSILFILVCVLLIGIILLQKGRGGGLSGAFGGVGGHSAFGSRTGDWFTGVTVGLVALFLLLGVITVRRFRPSTEITASQVPQPTEAPSDTSEGQTEEPAEKADQPAGAEGQTDGSPAAPTAAPVESDETTAAPAGEAG